MNKEEKWIYRRKILLQKCRELKERRQQFSENCEYSTKEIVENWGELIKKTSNKPQKPPRNVRMVLILQI